MMVISPTLKYAYVSVMKTGTNTMYKLLTERFAGKRIGKRFHAKNPAYIKPGWFTFKTARNPFTRAVSIWACTCFRADDKYGFQRMCKARGKNPTNFEQFMLCVANMPSKKLHGLILPQIAWLHGANIKFDAVVHIENLIEEFNALPFIGKPLSAKDFPKENQSSKQDFRTYYTDRAVNLVRKWAAKDFKKLGYSQELSHA